MSASDQPQLRIKEPTSRCGSTPASRSVASLSESSRLASLPAVGGDDQRHMSEDRKGPAERPVEQDLSRSARHEIRAPDHLVDAHRRVVDHDGQLIGGTDGVSRDDEVAARSARVDRDATQEKVVPGDRSRRDAEPPGEGSIAKTLGVGRGSVAQVPG